MIPDGPTGIYVLICAGILGVLLYGIFGYLTKNTQTRVIWVVGIIGFLLLLTFGGAFPS